MLGKDGFTHFLRGQIVKYDWRVVHKDKPVLDSQKLAWYAAKLEEHLSSVEAEEAEAR